jgi:glucose-6-phosphate 1-dehydrogenase
MIEKKPLNIIIFGATGDLAKKKLIPAFFNLFNNDVLHQDFSIIGFSRKDLSDLDYRVFVKNILEQKISNIDSHKLEIFLKKIFYVRGLLDEKESYNDLQKYLIKKDLDLKQCSNKLFYLAVPPNFYESIFINLGESDLILNCNKQIDSWTRVLVEKPFGSNEIEAKRLDKILGKLFDESQIFRIDHYLAKEALQNIISFRFANAMFEPLWNKEHIEKVQIKLYESGDLAGRYNFYDDVGALRDVGQNHILQMMALVAMEDPMSTNTDEIIKSRLNVLSKVTLFEKAINKVAFRAQYNDYELENNKISETETFFRLKLMIKNKKWDNVPFEIESGKGLKEDKIEIKIIFKDRASSVCKDALHCEYNNFINFQIQPEHKISIGFWFKEPGLSFDINQKELSYVYVDKTSIKDAYEKVLFDCIKGDQSLFTSTEEVSVQWSLISKICHEWKKIPLVKYERGIDPKDIL